MGPILLRGLHILVFSAFFAGHGLASPRSSRLLPLVPPGAEVVAGFQNHPGLHNHGRLLLTTRNNRLDLEDWQALTGVDSKRVFDEVIEVAASTLAGNLGEHLLLVRGRFDRERIFRSLELNGAKSTQYQGQPIRLIAPFARERGDMLDIRWLVILDNRIGMLGTPGLVREALSRHLNHSLADAVLEERLSLLRSDVTSWNVMSQSPRSRNISFAQPKSVWADLQEDTDLLMVGARFGSKVRIDFSIYANARRGPEFFSDKAAFFTDALAGGRMRKVLPARGPNIVRRSSSWEKTRFRARWNCRAGNSKRGVRSSPGVDCR